ncbi:FAD-binding protein [Microbacterium sp. STN6]|uniref:FAD-binding and (Fe-S)-binding domain-containing protein n=1 Tax=Microbacterium sp. STN6 TaxID=2995588 RepID=UPI002260A241|nr:FAD-binding and (Fe-S)-binding domain-containing protein [Microbacterium sp. STN6]MCX7521553.1 FAD-binding protein [Microbacterium sp. STN6]
MTRVDVPAPRIRSTGRSQPGAAHGVSALERDLAARVDGDVRFDRGYLSAYSTDASNFRVVPLGVVVPHTTDAAAEALAVCLEHGVAALPRGGGTSLAGQTTNDAVVIDFSRYCTRLIDMDLEARTCWVEPGIVLDDLNHRLEQHGLRFGPEPATHSRCTIGGMIGNNSCGATAQHTGKTADNTLALEVMLYDGTRMTLGETSDAEYESVVAAGGRPAELYRELRRLRDEYGGDVRRDFPRIPRRVSGYNLDQLLDENGFNLARALVGSEGGLALVLRAKLALMPVVRNRTVVMLGYDDRPTSADDVPAVLKHDPIALEGFDSKTIEYQRVKNLNADAVGLLPDGPRAWLIVQFGADTPEQAAEAAERFADDAREFAAHPTVDVFEDRDRQRLIWEVREAALGATAEVPGLPPMWSGWEDAAVAPERLGDYLRAFEKLLDEFDYDAASLYGHYGQGCVHTRIPFDLQTEAGIATYRAFLERAAHLVADLGGSLSGEHGDGRSRSELLPIMYEARTIEAFEAFKRAFDPRERMNPGMIAFPTRLDDNLRLGAEYSPAHPTTHFSYPDDHGDFAAAASRCVGVGLCRRHDGGVMCPSYMVTRDEQHSTRGRSRILFEMLEGHPDSPITDGWRSKEALEALDLCLACKGCKSDCPVNVDMATYKAEFLSHHYEGRLRPAAHYSMGWLPLIARVASRLPRVVNAFSQAPVISSVAKALGGIAQERQIPQFAPETFQRWFARRGAGSRASGVDGATLDTGATTGATLDTGATTDATTDAPGHRRQVVLWPDTFSNTFHPHVAQAAVEVLESAGWSVIVPQDAVCCGLTWISTGQLGVAERVLTRTAQVLAPYLQAGMLVLGLEPSCTAVFRSDAPELLPNDPLIARLKEQTVTLSELLINHSPGWEPPTLARHALIQQHCHQHAIMGSDPDLELLTRMGVDADMLDTGCCGLAGNFGFEKGHYEVSNACGERALYPTLRAADERDVVLADGFSCRTQIEQGDAGGRGGMHLAELIAAALHEGEGTDGALPERSYAPRTRTSRGARVAAVASAASLAAAVAIAATAGLARLLRRRATR